MIKQRKNAEKNVGEKKEKATQEKTYNTTRGNKPESTGERMKIKKISRKGKTIQTKQNIPKQRKKILPTSRGRWHKDIPTTKLNNFGVKHVNQENIKMLNGYATW